MGGPRPSGKHFGLRGQGRDEEQKLVTYVVPVASVRESCNGRRFPGYGHTLTDNQRAYFHRFGPVIGERARERATCQHKGAFRNQ